MYGTLKHCQAWIDDYETHEVSSRDCKSLSKHFKLHKLFLLLKLNCFDFCWLMRPSLVGGGGGVRVRVRVRGRYICS